MRTDTSCMDSTFRDLKKKRMSKEQKQICQQYNTYTYTFMIKMLNLLTENEILEQSRTSLADPQSILFINGTTDIRGDISAIVILIKLG